MRKAGSVVNLLHACVLTPRGRGAIAVVAVVGSGAREKVESLLRKKIPEPMRIYHGRIVDEVVVHWEPEGFTGSETVEVSCHGGAGAIRAVLDALAVREIDWNAYVGLAEKSGRLDAIQADAWRLLPHALTRLAAMVLMDQAEGALSKALAEGRHAPDWGIALVDPRRVVLAGLPNAGKSTLFNALFTAERALVHDEPGTTRDPVEDVIAIEGVPLILVDTAGVMEPRNDIERQAAERARREIERADLVVVVQDPALPRFELGRPCLEFSNPHDRAPDVASLRRAILDRLGVRPTYVPGAPVRFRRGQTF